MTHPFEAANLGKAPFTCVGMSEMLFALPDGNVKPGGSCDYCGTGIRYAFHIRSADDRAFKVGCDCVAKTSGKTSSLSHAVKREAHAFKLAKRTAEKRAEAAARAAEARANAEQFIIADDLGRAWAISQDNGDSYAARTIRDIMGQMARRGVALSSAQLDFVRKLVAQHDAPKVEPKPLPSFEGRVTIRGIIVSIKANDLYPGCKMLVLHADGWKVWGALPASLDDAKRGDEVEFVAAVTRSDNDPAFGFFSRPSKAKRAA